MHITDVVFRCGDCDYDLCSECYGGGGKAPQEHAVLYEVVEPKGIAYRRSATMSDTVSNPRGLEYGERIEGIRYGDGWLKVGLGLFLPLIVHGGPRDGEKVICAVDEATQIEVCGVRGYAASYVNGFYRLSHLQWNNRHSGKKLVIQIYGCFIAYTERGVLHTLMTRQPGLESVICIQSKHKTHIQPLFGSGKSN